MHVDLNRGQGKAEGGVLQCMHRAEGRAEGGVHCMWLSTRVREGQREM